MNILIYDQREKNISKMKEKFSIFAQNINIIQDENDINNNLNKLKSDVAILCFYDNDKNSLEIINSLKKQIVNKLMQIIVILNNFSTELHSKILNSGIDECLLNIDSFNELFKIIIAKLKRINELINYEKQLLERDFHREVEIFKSTIKEKNDVIDELKKKEDTAIDKSFFLYSNIKKYIDKMISTNNKVALIIASIDGVNKIKSFIKPETREYISNSYKEYMKSLESNFQNLFAFSESHFGLVIQFNEINDNYTEIIDASVKTIKESLPTKIGTGDILFHFPVAIGISINTGIYSKCTSVDLLDNALTANNYSIITSNNPPVYYNESINTKLCDILRESIHKYVIVSNNNNKEKKINITEHPVTLFPKVFFLLPPEQIETFVIKKLIRNEYSVYVLKDYKIVSRLLSKFQSSLLLINIDTLFPLEKWYDYIFSLKSDPNIKNLKIGTLTYNNNIPASIKSSFLIDLKLDCGFINLTNDIEKTTKTLIKVLDVNEVKGSRKHLRGKCINQNIRFCVNINNKTAYGRILDFSSLSIAVVFNTRDIFLKEGTKLENITVYFEDISITVDAEVHMVRQSSNNKRLYILTYNEESIKNVSEKIYYALEKLLKNEIENEIKSL